MMIEGKGLVRQCPILLKFVLPYLASTIVSTSLTCDDGESSVSLVLGRQASQCTTEAKQNKAIR